MNISATEFFFLALYLEDEMDLHILTIERELLKSSQDLVLDDRGLWLLSLVEHDEKMSQARIAVVLRSSQAFLQKLFSSIQTGSRKRRWNLQRRRA
jgi:hypothetical protein